jgi:hypothetical protein
MFSPPAGQILRDQGGGVFSAADRYSPAAGEYLSFGLGYFTRRGRCVMAEVLADKAATAEKQSWEAFVKQEVLNFLLGHNLQAVTVDDGAGRKATIKRTAKGDYSVQITSNEIL